MTLNSGHLLFQRNDNTTQTGRIAILVHKKRKHLVNKMKAVSDRIIYIMIKLNKRYSLQIIQAYSPTSSSQDEDIEQFYEDLTKARISEKAYFTIIMGDFNAKIGRRTQTDAPSIGDFGLGTRNSRDQMLMDFLNKEKMYCMNTFFQKKSQRKWTWKSPGDTVRNKIDYILSSDKDICTDVSVLNRFNSGSDHRLVRACFRIDTRFERKMSKYPHKGRAKEQGTGIPSSNRKEAGPNTEAQPDDIRRTNL